MVTSIFEIEALQFSVVGGKLSGNIIPIISYDCNVTSSFFVYTKYNVKDIVKVYICLDCPVGKLTSIDQKQE